MYFTKGTSGVYHILAHPKSGSAPPPCGAKAERFDLIMYQAGRQTPNIVAEMPAGARLCKHCEAAARKGNHAL